MFIYFNKIFWYSFIKYNAMPQIPAKVQVQFYKKKNPKTVDWNQ